MRVSLPVVLGMCLLLPGIAQAQATPAKPQTPPPAAANPQTPPAGAKPAAPAAARKEIKVPETVLKTYVGEYEVAPGQVLAITFDQGSLWGQPGQQQKRQLFAETNSKFFLKDLDVQIAFQKDAKGVVTGLLMDQAGRPQRDAKKIK